MTRNLLAISYAKRALDKDSREGQRMAELAVGLDRYVMVVFTRAAEGLPREYHDGNLAIYATHSRSRFLMLFDAYRLARRILRDSAADWVISAQDPFATSLVAYPLARRTDNTFHIQLHGDDVMNPCWYRYSLTNRIWRRVGLWMLRRAERIRVVSARTKKALSRVPGLTAPVAVLPVQTNLQPFLRAGQTRGRTDDGVTRCLYVGRFSPEKDLLRMIKIFALVHKANPQTELTLLGEGKDLSVLKKQINKLDLTAVVTITPWTEDVPSIMAEHDVLVLTSKHEGFALVLLEAMAAGLAVLSTDVGCVGEWCIPNEHCLLLSATSDEKARDSWLKISEDNSLRQRLASSGYRAAKEYQAAQNNYQTAWTASFFG